MSRLVSLVGVYDARSDLRSELAYWVGARLGRRHCALCDITHGTFRERSSWRQCRDGLPVPFAQVHLDERPDEIVALTDGAVPCVVARTDDGDLVLLDRDALERCAGDPDRLVSAIAAAVEQQELSWT